MNWAVSKVRPADSILVKSAGKTERPTMPPKSEEPLTPQLIRTVGIGKKF